jgi:hypothetical protein
MTGGDRVGNLLYNNGRKLGKFPGRMRRNWLHKANLAETFGVRQSNCRLLRAKSTSRVEGGTDPPPAGKSSALQT